MATSFNRSILVAIFAQLFFLNCKYILCHTTLTSITVQGKSLEPFNVYEVSPHNSLEFHFKVNDSSNINRTIGLTPYDNYNSNMCNYTQITQTFKVSETNISFSKNTSAYSMLYLCEQSPVDTKKWIHLGNSNRIKVSNSIPVLSGIRAKGNKVDILEDGTTSVPADKLVLIRLYGQYLTPETTVAITTEKRPARSTCENVPVLGYYKLHTSNNFYTATFKVVLPLSHGNSEFYYFCINKPGSKEYIHQGDMPWLRIHSEAPLMPKWIQIVLIFILLFLSGLFSGLNLGLMTLDSTELQVISNCGSPKEKRYAKIIAPLRLRGNYLLCSLLLGNVLVNSTLTILLDDLTTGLVAIIGSTMSIVIIGEIIPQAICSRHGLAVGAKTSVITRFFMLLTFPLSFPISKILDFVLGDEIGNVYDRERLMEYIRVTKDYNKLQTDEVNIISGALGLRSKKVFEVMTRIEDVFMLPLEATLNFELMNEIVRRGYTRIPIFQNDDRNSIIALLNTKDLAFVDPDDNLPLKVLSNFYNHPIKYIFEDETLDVTLNEFRKGRSHLALVHRIVSMEGKDPYYEITGIVTLEDVIEEILQFEIVDETDIISDNKHKLKRESNDKQDFSDFAKIGGGQKETAVISPQMALATYQFLCTTFEQFQKPFISETVLRRLMGQNIYFQMKVSKNPDKNYLYQTGKPAEYFILLLEGRVNVVIGKENIEYDAGSFSYFGLPTINYENIVINNDQAGTTALNEESLTSAKYTFIPDYTVTVLCDLSYLKIYRAVYLAAVRATLLECHQQEDAPMTDETRVLWEKELNVANTMRQSPLTQDPSPPYSSLSLADSSSTRTHRRSIFKPRSSADNSPSEFTSSPSKDHAPQYHIRKFEENSTDGFQPVILNSEDTERTCLTDSLKNEELPNNTVDMLGVQNSLAAGESLIQCEKHIISSSTSPTTDNAKCGDENQVNSRKKHSIKGNR